tara:strand:- start:848 stop:1204 length:357 start_codon:yes stop_codon:yes gene_type:complete
MMKALIYNSKVVDICDVEFEVHSSMNWIDAPDDCEAGWELQNDALVAPVGPTAEERAEEARMRRNSLLAETDWTQANDSPLTDADKQTWATYRTSLRDLTNHASWPDLTDADWPTKPS